jgi:hypothetical protein
MQLARGTRGRYSEYSHGYSGNSHGVLGVHTGTVDSHGYSGCSYRSLRPGYSGVLTCSTRGYSNGLAAEERRKQMAFCFGLKSLAARSDVVTFARICISIYLSVYHICAGTDVPTSAPRPARGRHDGAWAGAVRRYEPPGGHVRCRGQPRVSSRSTPVKVPRVPKCIRTLREYPEYRGLSTQVLRKDVST